MALQGIFTSFNILYAIEVDDPNRQDVSHTCHMFCIQLLLQLLSKKVGQEHEHQTIDHWDESFIQ